MSSKLRRVASSISIRTPGGENIDPCEDLTVRIAKTLRDECPTFVRDGGFIRPGFDERYDQFVELATGGKSWIAKYQAFEMVRFFYKIFAY